MTTETGNKTGNNESGNQTSLEPEKNRISEQQRHELPERDFSDRLDMAEAKFSARNTDEDLGKSSEKPMSAGLGLAFRAASELVVALCVGVAVGLWIDGMFGTKPWFLLIMLVTCFAAGVLNTWRAVSGTGGALGYGSFEERQAHRTAAESPPPKNKTLNAETESAALNSPDTLQAKDLEPTKSQGELGLASQCDDALKKPPQ